MPILYCIVFASFFVNRLYPVTTTAVSLHKATTIDISHSYSFSLSLHNLLESKWFMNTDQVKNSELLHVTLKASKFIPTIKIYNYN